MNDAPDAFPDDAFPDDVSEADRDAIRFLHAAGIQDPAAHFRALNAHVRSTLPGRSANVPPRSHDAAPNPTAP